LNGTERQTNGLLDWNLTRTAGDAELNSGGVIIFGSLYFKAKFPRKLLKMINLKERAAKH
jgi:hypothetical protein